MPGSDKVKLYVATVLLTFIVLGIVVMGVRTMLDPSRINVFNQAGLSSATVQIWGAYCVVSMLLMAHPRTFVLGCAMLLLNNLFTIGCYLKASNPGGAALEALSIAIPATLYWLGHPYTRWRS